MRLWNKCVSCLLRMNRRHFSLEVPALAGALIILCISGFVRSEEMPLRPRMPFLEKPGASDQMVSIDLNRVDIRVFVKTISQLTGVNFYVDDKIQGTVTIMSPTKVRLGNVYNVFESVLAAHSYAAVVSGDIVKVIPRSVAAKGNLPVRVGADPSNILQEDQLVTQVIPLRYINVTQVNALVAGLVSSDGQVTVYSESNTLVITDTSSTIYRVARILRELDIEKPRENIKYTQLKFASAQQLSGQLTEIVERGQERAAGSTKRLTSDMKDGSAKILADDRTNSLIIMATPETMAIVDTLVAQLDIESPLEAGYVHVIYLENAEALDMEKSLSAALGRLTAEVSRDTRSSLQITADESTNALIVVASPQDYKVVESMVKQLDVVREQVLIEFQIVEASTNVLKELGIDWATMDQAVADSVRGFGATNLGPRVEAMAGDTEGLAVGLYKQVGDVTQIGAILKALETHSGINILSTPSVLTSNHQEAHIMVGDNVPYVSQSRVTEPGVQLQTAIKTYAYKDVGIEMTVTPHVSVGGLVRMEVDTSFSKLIAGTTGLGGDTPTTANRKATTVISIMTDTTVVIGGLMRDDIEKVIVKVPLLGDLPIIGGLFRHQKDVIEKTNMLLFITPRVLSDRASLLEMTEQKDREHKEASKSLGL
jgi:general secretion pathway protein D